MHSAQGRLCAAAVPAAALAAGGIASAALHCCSVVDVWGAGQRSSSSSSVQWMWSTCCYCADCR
eukprot:6966-Heterococcus_DN1.PRE.5